MIRFFFVAISIQFIANSYCIGQDLLDRLNRLPPTKIQSAPVFDIEKKYIFSIDSINKLLIIQDFRISPISKEIHFDQLIFEVPLTDLNNGSFRAAKDVDDKTLFNFKIGTTGNKTSIIQYFLRDDQVVAVRAQDIMTLGTWAYTEELEQEFKEIIRLFTSKTPDKSYSTNLFGGMKSLYKFSSSIVTTVGATDTVKQLSFGYYYRDGLKRPSYYLGTKNINSSNSKLLKDLNKELKRTVGDNIRRNPVFIYLNSIGEIESIYFPNLSKQDNKSINISNLGKFTPGDDGDQSVKNKLLLIVK